MAGESYLELRNFTTGTRLGIITGATGSGADRQNGFLRLTTTRRVNAPGLLRVELPGDHPLAATLPDKTLVIQHRRDVERGIDWYREFVGVFRDPEYRRQGRQRRWTLTCPGLLSILGWYHVLWPAGVANRSTFTSVAGETVMKNLVRYNAVAADATVANGRDRDAPDYDVSLQADAAGGNVLDWTANRSRTLLEELQDLATVAGGDLDLVYVTPTSRQFRFYAGQRGSDKSATIRFAENLGNMDNIQFARQRSGERTAAIVAGTGQEAVRSTTERNGVNYDLTNDIEVFVDARDLNPDTPAARSARGDARLDEVTARDVFSFDAVQTANAYYAPTGTRSYTLGDLVSARRPDGVTVAQQVYGITLDWAPGDTEQITTELHTQ